MQTQKNHWPSILILIIVAIGIMFFFSIASVMGMISFVSLFDHSNPPVDYMIVAFSAGAEMLLLIACAWFVLQKTMGNHSAGAPTIFTFDIWQALGIPFIVIASISLGAVVAHYANEYLSWFILPMTTLLVILPPIIFYIGVGSNQIGSGSRWRIWGTIGLGLTISPLLMIVLELLILVFGVIVAAIVLSLHPGQLEEAKAFAQLLRNQTDEDAALVLLAPYLSDPRVIAGILGYIALLVPMIEEMLKPLAVWLFARSITKPSQGFVLGMLSGGAFAMMESLNASADGSTSWPVVVGVRAGTSLLHIVLSGLMGHAIVAGFKEKKWLRLMFNYLGVVAIHGIWNACAVGAGLSANGELFGKPEWLVTYLPASVGGIFTLGIGIFIILIASNRKIRADSIQENTKDQE